MILIRCDRCGKELDKKAWQNLQLKEMAMTTKDGNVLMKIDLCHDCEEDFWKWLKGGDTE